MRKVLPGGPGRRPRRPPGPAGCAAATGPDGHVIPAGHPSSRRQGSPTGVRRVKRTRNLDVRKDGTVLDGPDSAGCVTVRAPDVIPGEAAFGATTSPAAGPQV